MKYMQLNTNLMWLIILNKFLEEKYFFIFILSVTREIKTYIEQEKSKLFGH